MAEDPKPPARIRDPLLLKQFRLEHIGEPCMRCELRPGTQAHHLAFKSQSGHDAEENLLWVCIHCHLDLHGIRSVI